MTKKWDVRVILTRADERVELLLGQVELDAIDEALQALRIDDPHDSMLERIRQAAERWNRRRKER